VPNKKYKLFDAGTIQKRIADFLIAKKTKQEQRQAINSEIVEQIKQAHKQGLSEKEIAEVIGEHVSKSWVHSILAKEKAKGSTPNAI
jgi:DNA-binding transcriptional regulator YhcF (GntR family)